MTKDRAQRERREVPVDAPSTTPAERAEAVERLLDEWMADKSGYDERTWPLLAEALPFVAHPQIRNRGTVGGSIAHADPAAELPAVMVALAARFHLSGPNGARTVDADDFYTGLFGTALEPGRRRQSAPMRAAE